jgi:hypothetical protein
MKLLDRILLIVWVAIGYVVAFIKTFLFPERKFDHSGLHTFDARAKSVAIEVKLWMQHWFSLLQHSPTA